MSLAQPEEADVDAARCRGYLMGKAAAERLAILDVKEACAACYEAGLVAAANALLALARNKAKSAGWAGAPFLYEDQLLSLIAHVKATGRLPEEAV